MNAIKERKIVYTSGQIAERVRAMAAEIDAFYGDEPLVAVCVLKGAVFFFTDLVRAMRSENLELDFVRLSSYGKGTSSSRHVVFSKDVDCDGVSYEGRENGSGTAPGLENLLLACLIHFIDSLQKLGSCEGAFLNASTHLTFALLT